MELPSDGGKPPHPCLSLVAAADAPFGERLGEWVRTKPERVLTEFRERDALREREIGWVGAGGESGAGSGVADGIDDRGNLVVVSSEGERLSLGSGEVSLTVPGQRDD